MAFNSFRSSGVQVDGPFVILSCWKKFYWNVPRWTFWLCQIQSTSKLSFKYIDDMKHIVSCSGSAQREVCKKRRKSLFFCISAYFCMFINALVTWNSRITFNIIKLLSKNQLVLTSCGHSRHLAHSILAITNILIQLTFENWLFKIYVCDQTHSVTSHLKSREKTVAHHNTRSFRRLFMMKKNNCCELTSQDKVKILVLSADTFFRTMKNTWVFTCEWNWMESQTQSQEGDLPGLSCTYCSDTQPYRCFIISQSMHVAKVSYAFQSVEKKRGRTLFPY